MCCKPDTLEPPIWRAWRPDMERSVIVNHWDAGCKALHKAPWWEINLSPQKRTRKTEANHTPMVISLPTSLSISFEQKCYIIPFFNFPNSRMHRDDIQYLLILKQTEWELKFSVIRKDNLCIC